MNGPEDLSEILRDWEYDEEDNVRFLTARDGRDIMQIRLPLGIEQYDLDGRPDGSRPEGETSFLDIYRKKVGAAAERGEAPIFDSRDFHRLHDEGVLFYYRYLALFQVGQYDRVIRDTEHNLAICRLLEKYYPDSERDELLQYRPYIHRMNAISRAMVRLADDEKKRAVEEIEKGRSDIENLDVVTTPIFEFEKIRSLRHLAQVLKQIRGDESEKGSRGFREQLSEELSRAVEAEDYERAARLRDRINKLK